MATALTNTTAKAIGNYVGETSKQIREGLIYFDFLKIIKRICVNTNNIF